MADPAVWERLLLRDSSPDVRARAARAVGRIRSARLASLLRATMAAESRGAVRAEILFALGQTPDPDGGSRAPLDAALVDRSPLLRARAAEALGKLGGTGAVPALLRLLEDPHPDVRSAALLGLVRARGRRAAPKDPLEEGLRISLLRRLSALLHEAEEGVRWRAAYALAEIEVPGRLEPLVETTRSQEDVARLFAVRAIGRLTDEPQVRRNALLALLLTEKNPHVAAAAAEGLGRTPSEAAVDALLSAAVRNTGPADHHLRRAALAALGEMGPPGRGESRLRATLCEALEDPSPSVRSEALRTYARLFPKEGLRRISPLVASPRAGERRMAARAAAVLPFSAIGEMLTRLVRDTEPLVAGEALESLGQFREGKEARRGAALQALQSVDLAIRAGGLTLLRRCGGPGDIRAIVRAFDASPGEENAEVRAEAVRTAAALGKKGATSFLEDAFSDPSAAVRAAAGKELAALGEKRAAKPTEAGEPPSSVTIRAGVEFATNRRDPRAILHTTRGDLVIELLREEAPRHVQSFVDLARAGLYDGLSFHRVVSGFVIQGLDPRGDGWGTGGVFLRDEINPVPYLTGTVGMPNAGPDSGGCQIFITHVPTPHLDGGYTVFGRVVEGMGIVDAIDVGDVCIRVEILEPR